jgi:adenine-specific DNA-methyltransferase
MKETQLYGQSPDLARANYEKLKALFPDIVSDGKIDGEKLKQLVGEYLDEAPERYNFSWNGKGQAIE